LSCLEGVRHDMTSMATEAGIEVRVVNGQQLIFGFHQSCLQPTVESNGEIASV
jgi:hypothetical protein